MRVLNARISCGWRIAGEVELPQPDHEMVLVGESREGEAGGDAGFRQAGEIDVGRQVDFARAARIGVRAGVQRRRIAFPGRAPGDSTRGGGA